MTKHHEIADNGLETLLKAPKAKETHDGQGLYLVVNGQQQGSWVYAYKSPVRLNKAGTGPMATKYTFGNCSLRNKQVEGMTLVEARDRHAQLRQDVLAGKDPVLVSVAPETSRRVEQKQLQDEAADNARRAKEDLPPKNSFRDVALVLQARNRARLDASTILDFHRTLTKYVYPVFGDKQVADITSQQFKVIQDEIMAAGHMQALKKVRRFTSQVFDYALRPEVNLRLLANPVFKDNELRDFIPKAKPRAAITDADGIRELMIAINTPVPAQVEWDLHGGRYATQTVVRALRFTALTAQRRSNVCEMRKEHVDFEARTWTIPGDVMKGRKVLKMRGEIEAHTVYLSTQAVALLKAQFADHPHSPFVFPGQFKGQGGCMGKTAMTDRLAVLGFKGQMTGHGFRAMLRTVCARDLGINPLLLETVLAHKDARNGLAIANQIQRMLDGGMKGVYDRTSYTVECVGVMQAWADHLDQLVKPRLTLVATEPQPVLEFAQAA